MKKEGLEKLDRDWVELIKEALEIGVSEEEIRSFLRKSKDYATTTIHAGEG